MAADSVGTWFQKNEGQFRAAFADFAKNWVQQNQTSIECVANVVSAGIQWLQENRQRLLVLTEQAEELSTAVLAYSDPGFLRANTNPNGIDPDEVLSLRLFPHWVSRFRNVGWAGLVEHMGEPQRVRFGSRAVMERAPDGDTRLTPNVDLSIGEWMRRLSSLARARQYQDQRRTYQPLSGQEVADQESPDQPSFSQESADQRLESEADPGERLRSLVSHSSLSEREMAVFQYRQSGKKHCQIAVLLGISASTSRVHLKNALAKLKNEQTMRY